MSTAVVESTICWLSRHAEAGTRLLMWNGLDSLRMFSQYPLSEPVRAALGRVTTHISDVSLAETLQLVETGVVAPHRMPDFPLLDWISGDRRRQLSGINWALEYLGWLVAAVLALEAADTAAARLCVSPVADIVSGDVSVPREVSDDVANRLRWSLSGDSVLPL